MQDDYPLPDDGDAEEARLREQERNEIDSLASDLLRDVIEDEDPHAEEREKLGFSLAWWADEGEHNSPPLDIVVDLTNQACGRTHYLRELEEYGYDSKAMPANITLDSVTGPLVVAALQILGTLHSHIRDEVTLVLKQIFDAIPEPTEEEEAALLDAVEQLENAKLARFAESVGAQVMTTDEFAEHLVEQDDRRREAELN